MKRVTRVFTRFIAVLLLVGADRLLTANLHAEEIKSSPMVAAFAIVYHDFEVRLEAVPGSSDIEQHLARISNYRVTLHQDNERIVVEITPLPFRGSSLRGGGGEYIVDAVAQRVLSFEPYR